MKLRPTLPERPAFMTVLPLFDVLALLLVFLTLGTTFIVERGIAIELPKTDLDLTRYLDPIDLSVGGGSQGGLLLEGEEVLLPDLLEELLALQEEERWVEGDTVLIKADVGVALGRFNEVVELVQKAGFRAAQAVRQVED